MADILDIHGTLPSSFWESTSFTADPELGALHSAIVSRLRQESPDADTLELMMMERVCFLYLYMRFYESESGTKLSMSREYKEILQTWIKFAADLRAMRMKAEEIQSVRLAIVSEVSSALKKALDGLDPHISAAVQTKLVSLVAV